LTQDLEAGGVFSLPQSHTSLWGWGFFNADQRGVLNASLQNRLDIAYRRGASTIVIVVSPAMGMTGQTGFTDESGYAGVAQKM
jgi:hypothetical protein